MAAPEGSSDCLFCKIVNGDIPADVVRETPTSVVFRDVNPEAPTHLLVIPKRHVANVAELAAASSAELADVFGLVGAVAEAEGLTGGYRTVYNTGADAHQTVFHAHVHVLGGRTMTWPPG